MTLTRTVWCRGGLRLAAICGAALSLFASIAVADAGPSNPAPSTGERGVLRERIVDVDVSDYAWLCAADGFGKAKEHTLEFFPGVKITVVQDGREREEDTVTWTGHVKDEPEAGAVISASHVCPPTRGRPPAVDALIDLQTRAYHITTLPGQPPRLRITEEDPNTRRRPEPDNAHLDASTVRKLHDSLRGRAPVSPANPAVVDVLAGYTPAAVQRVGGEQAMLARLRLAESYMNQALADSNVAASIDIVASYNTGYQGEQTAAVMLGKLSDSEDPQLGAKAHGFREQLGVDLVTVVNNVLVGSSGQGSLPTGGEMDSELAYSVVDVQSLVDWYNLGHEIGHNLGLFHDRATLDQQAPGRYEQMLNRPYGTGWITPRRDYHTLMAYAVTCGGPCRTVNQYSNTENTVDGQPLGDASNNNAALARLTIPIVADYRALTMRRPRHALTLEPSAHGTIRPAVYGPYAPGTTVAVTAKPAEGYRVAAWIANGVRHDITADHVTLTMDRPYTLSAVFTRD
ncbi:M12 family metallo-peptidase [Streptomyces sp. NPDC021622]|uniref:InlB B-repeat-containing protein n=1 Tax=Streptomyces sp. NPDC021622 TaxID=3155013 RepID=UPI0033C775ED